MTASDVLFLGSVYLYIGAAVAVVFLVFAVGRIDENASGAWIFRPLIVPGVVLIWPIVLWRWYVLFKGEDRLARHQMPRKTQRWGQLIFSGFIVAVICTAVLTRQSWDDLAPPVRLEAPE